MAFFNDFMEESVIDMGGGLNDADSIKEAEYLESLEASDHGNVDFDELCLSVAVENEQNFNMIMNVTAVEELNYALEHGEVMPITEGTVGDFFNKIKGMIDKAWTKIKEIFDKAISWVESIIRTDKSIISKYKEKILSFDGDLDFKGYNFNQANLLTPVYENVARGLEQIINNVEKIISTKSVNTDEKFDTSDFKDSSSKIRYAALNNGSTSGSIAEEDFKTKLKKHFGFNEKESVIYKGEAILAELIGGSSFKKCIKFGYSKTKNAIATMRKEIKIVEKAIQTSIKNGGGDKNEGFGKYANAAAKCCSSAISVLNTAQRIHIKALNTYHTQCRAMAVKAAKKSDKKDDDKKKTNESVDFASFLV